MDKDYKQTIEWLTKELTQAQEELKNIKAIEKEHQRINGELREANKLLNEQHISLYNKYCEELKRKNKAIKVINDMADLGYVDGNIYYMQSPEFEVRAKVLLEILKGGSDE